MKCLRCGYCCSFPVIIVKPEYVDVFDPENLEMVEEWTILKKQGEMCPHLKFQGDLATCQVHNQPWFKDSVCGRYEQIGWEDDDVCRLGNYIKKEKINVRKKYFNKENQLPLTEAKWYEKKIKNERVLDSRAFTYRSKLVEFLKENNVSFDPATPTKELETLLKNIR